MSIQPTFHFPLAEGVALLLLYSGRSNYKHVETQLDSPSSTAACSGPKHSSAGKFYMLPTAPITPSIILKSYTSTPHTGKKKWAFQTDGKHKVSVDECFACILKSSWSATACNHCGSALCMKQLSFSPPLPKKQKTNNLQSLVSKCWQLKTNTVHSSMPACSITYHSGLQWLLAAKGGSSNYSTVGGSRTAAICLPQQDCVTHVCLQSIHTGKFSTLEPT